MRPRYLLDTNMCIYLMKHQPAEVATRFAQCYVGEVVMSAVTMAELEYGVSCSGEKEQQNRSALDRLLEDIPPEPFDQVATSRAIPV
jgi:tRNA(fMet)-specific endonuclease VapC